MSAEDPGWGGPQEVSPTSHLHVHSPVLCVAGGDPPGAPGTGDAGDILGTGDAGDQPGIPFL